MYKHVCSNEHRGGFRIFIGGGGGANDQEREARSPLRPGPLEALRVFDALLCLFLSILIQNGILKKQSIKFIYLFIFLFIFFFFLGGGGGGEHGPVVPPPPKSTTVNSTPLLFMAIYMQTLARFFFFTFNKAGFILLNEAGLDTRKILI